MSMHTRHWGLLSLAGIEVGKALGTVCADPSMVEGLQQGDIMQLFALGIVVADWIKARYKQKSDPKIDA